MIRPNEPFHNETSTINPKATRDFTKVLREMQPFWHQAIADPEAHIAQGLLPTQRGTALKADVSFDVLQKHVTLMVRLPLAEELDVPRQRCLFRFQNRPHGLASVIFDPEDRLLLLVSCSVLPDAKAARVVISRVVAHLLDVLEDEDLHRILN